MMMARIVLYTFVAVFCCLPAPAQTTPTRPDRPLIRIDVNTVFLRVAVTDKKNRAVPGLGKEFFKVYEDGVEQNISMFSEGPSPISVGIIFDVSRSMEENHNFAAAQRALMRFLDKIDSRDEFFLIAFNQETRLVTDFIHDKATIANYVATQHPTGTTAIYDAVYMGLLKIQEARNNRKALILISDGEDNSSRYTLSEVKQLERESDVQIYAIGEWGSLKCGDPETGLLDCGKDKLEGIVELTGGRAFFPDRFQEITYYLDVIHGELRNQYILGYVPSRKDHDGTWRRIQVKVNAPKGSPKLSVRTREGYYPPR